MYATCEADDIAGRNRYFAHCQSRNEPLVVIHPNGDFATIYWDYISMQGYRRGEHVLIDQRSASYANAMMHDLDHLFSSVGPRGHMMSGETGGGFGYLDNVPRTEAPRIAMGIYNILVTYLREDSPADN